MRIKMRVELPDCKRCCFCLPLRYGILTTGYIKLVFEVLVVFLSTAGLVMVTASNIYESMKVIEEIVVYSIALMIFLVDICMTIVCLVGGHQKNPSKLRIYYIYTIVCTSLFTFIFVSLSFADFYVFSKESKYMNTKDLLVVATDMTVMQFMIGFGYIGIQIYYVLLLRSEIKKLNSNCKFRFSNVAAEAEAHCTLDNGTVLQTVNTEQLDRDTI